MFGIGEDMLMSLCEGRRPTMTAHLGDGEATHPWAEVEVIDN